MYAKQRNSAQKMNKHLSNLDLHSKKPQLEKCPFCGSAVNVGNSHSGIRYYNCPGCYLKASFTYSESDEESDRSWNERV